MSFVGAARRSTLSLQPRRPGARFRACDWHKGVGQSSPAHMSSLVVLLEAF